MSRRVRRATFGPRSSVPVSAACVVANGVRETLGSLFGSPVVLRLCEPVVPAASAWPAILERAVLYRVRGSLADAIVVLRSPDAAALAAGVFGEPRSAVANDRVLSPLERRIVDRAASAIAAHLASVAGAREGHAVEHLTAAPALVTYFELLIEEPVDARIGIALSRDPLPEPRGALDVAHLAGVRLALEASIELGAIETRAVARLAPGAFLPMPARDPLRCRLRLHGRTIANGTCGVRNGRYAVALETVSGIA